MPTVNDMFDKYEKERLLELKPRSQNDYRRHIRQLRAKFGQQNCRDVTRSALSEFINVPKGKIHMNRRLAVSSAVFNKAMDWGWVDNNPCYLLNAKRERNLTLEELEAAMKLASKSPLAFKTAMVMDLAFHTGQNQGAIVGLRWSAVDEQGGVIRFRDSHSDQPISVLITPALRANLDPRKEGDWGQGIRGCDAKLYSLHE